MKIKSSSSNKFYEVTPHSCTCPDYVYRQAKHGGKCKHIIKTYYPQTQDADELKDMRQFFNSGAHIDEAYEKFGDEKIHRWIELGEICKFKGKFVLLE
jgi:hypothetical protein